jgi:hypothetical protein
MRTFAGSLAFLLLGALPGTLLRADDVYLKNGRSFEGVVAEVTDAQVRIILPGGSISLARSAVDRVEKSETNLSDYLGRKEEIMAREKHASRNAADWLELARWARAAGFTQGAREAALTAAEIDPRDPGLPTLLRPFGYVYEERMDRWIPYGDSMRLHGFVEVGGQWMTPQEAQARAQQQLQVQTAMAAQAAAAAASQARDMVAMSQGGGYPGYDAGSYNGYDPGTVVGGYYGDVWWPGGYGGVFTVPGLGYHGAYGFGGYPQGYEHRRGVGGVGGRGRSPMAVHSPVRGGGMGHSGGGVRR